MKNLAFFAIVLAIIYFGGNETGLLPSLSDQPAGRSTTGNNTLTSAIRNHQSDVQVQGFGDVSRVPPDDNEGSRHQRFILRVSSGDTILMAHNIDLAPRITPLHVGDEVEFFGEYEWNPRGGMIHWTHHDPGGRHVSGWLKHQGRTYR